MTAKTSASPEEGRHEQAADRGGRRPSRDRRRRSTAGAGRSTRHGAAAGPGRGVHRCAGGWRRPAGGAAARSGRLGGDVAAGRPRAGAGPSRGRADLPGLGASEVPDGPPDAARVLAWLGALLQRTCPTPPALVGASLGASVAARFAIAHPQRLSRLVLVGAGSLARFRPAPGVALAMIRFVARPSERTHHGFLRQIAVDPARVRALTGARWAASQAYLLDRARTLGVRALRLAAARGRGRRPLLDRAAGGVPGGAAGRARRRLTEAPAATTRRLR
jgi:pimeloyl-ACP methyl ester carboxylesterase